MNGSRVAAPRCAAVAPVPVFGPVMTPAEPPPGGVAVGGAIVAVGATRVGSLVLVAAAVAVLVGVAEWTARGAVGVPHGTAVASPTLTSAGAAGPVLDDVWLKNAAASL